MEGALFLAWHVTCVVCPVHKGVVCIRTPAIRAAAAAAAGIVVGGAARLQQQLFSKIAWDIWEIHFASHFVARSLFEHGPKAYNPTFRALGFTGLGF